MQLVLFGLVMAVFAASGVVPLLAVQDRRLSPRDGFAAAGALLTAGLGAMNLGGIAYLLFTGEASGLVVGLGALPLIAALTAWRAMRLNGGKRAVALLGAAALAGGGLPAYFVLPVAAVAVVVTTVCFLAGLTDPGALARRFDPRV